MLKRFFAFVLVLAMAGMLVSSAYAQSYYFALVENTVHVFWNEDGSSALEYTLVFANQPGASPIEYVDMGMPNDYFDMGTVSAQVDGRAVNVSRGDYEGSGYGFAVVLGQAAIPPGSNGTVTVQVGRIERVLYNNDEKSDYASAVFSPLWFGSQYTTGSTKMTVVFHLPPGVQPEESIYYPAEGGWPGNLEPIAGFDGEGRITYTWVSSQALPYQQYTFGASFPKTYIPESAIVQPSFFEMLGINPDDLIGFAFFCCFGLIFFGSPVLGVIAEQRRKLQYLPPKLKIEGHGIKRGLTAVEAAVLMEQPLDKVMTMVLFGALKKGAAEVVTRDPLKIRITADPLPDTLREYEKDFLLAMAENANTARRTKLQQMMVGLVKSVTEKMKGFSRRDTVEYYKSIMEKAWAQISQADTPEVQSKMFDEAMEWTMLDKDYDDRTRRTFTRPIYVPTWWGRYDPVYRTSGPVQSGGGFEFGSAGTSSGGRGAALPGADFAASVVTGVQTFSTNVIGNLNTFTGNVTKTTNPPPPPSRSSGGSRSGGGCACACACAGCACACAGGGR